MHLDIFGEGIKVGIVKLVNGKLIINVFKCPYADATKQDEIDYHDVIQGTVEDKYRMLRDNPENDEDISAKDHPEEVFNNLYRLCHCSDIHFTEPIPDEEDKPKVKGIIEKAMPSGMRPAKLNEKADWVGKRGGRYKKLRQGEMSPTEDSGGVKNEIKQYESLDQDTIERITDTQSVWIAESKQYVASKDISSKLINRVVQGTHVSLNICKALDGASLEDKGRKLFLSEEGNTIHGIAMIKNHSDKQIEIEALTTSPKIIAERQRRGIGTTMVHRIVKQARESGVERIILKPTWDSIKFYDKLGFKEGKENGIVSLEGKGIDKFLSKFENTKVTKAQLFAPYEFGEIDLSGMFKLEDLHSPIINNLGWKGSAGGAGRRAINPDFRMYSNVMPAASDLKVPYEKVGEIGNVEVPYRHGIITGANKSPYRQPYKKPAMPYKQGIMSQSQIKGQSQIEGQEERKSMGNSEIKKPEPNNKIYNIKISGGAKPRENLESHPHVPKWPKVEGIIDKCLHPKINKAETLKPPKGSTAQILNQQNQALSLQSQAQSAKIGTSNAPMPVQKDFDNEFYTKIVRGKRKELKDYNVNKINNNNEQQNPSIEQKSDDPKQIKQRLLGNIQHFLEKYEEDNTMNKKEKNQLSNIKKNIAKLNVDEDGNIWDDQWSNYGGGKETEDSFRKKHNLPKLPDINNPNKKEDNPIVKKDINMFLKGYESLAYLGNELSDDRLFDIFKKAVRVNEDKRLGIKMNNEDRIAKIIAIDGVAHALHMNKSQDGTSQYKILDDLASVSKSLGEKERDTRLIIINNPDTAKDIEKLLKIEILQKSGLERNSKFWKLLEKAIKIGVKQLNNFELVALREFLYAKM